MVRGLLEDRFKLVLIKEPRQADIYTLGVVRSDGRLGPDLRSQQDAVCDARRAAAAAAGTVLFLPPVPPGGARPSMGGVCTTIAALVANLQRSLGTTVIDRTGLTGLWDYTLTYSGQLTSAPVDTAKDAPPPLFAALQEQLGLKLERQRGFVDAFVIKSVQPPTDN
jgi:uncharacterized protein (TIGR03435 family)